MTPRFTPRSYRTIAPPQAAEPLSTVLLAALLLGEVERPQTYASLVPVVFGVALSCASSASFNATAVSAPRPPPTPSPTPSPTPTSYSHLLLPPPTPSPTPSPYSLTLLPPPTPPFAFPLSHPNSPTPPQLAYPTPTPLAPALTLTLPRCGARIESGLQRADRPLEAPQARPPGSGRVAL